MENKVIKLTEEELEALNSVKQQKETLKAELADLGIIRFNLEKRDQQAKEYYEHITKYEKDVAKNLQDKYGNGIIDIQSGTVTLK